jgi:phosphonate transport system ATP-binding protein
MTPTPVILSVRTVSKTFHGVRALDQVSLEAMRGEMIALIGPSGSGKSTLLRTLAGLTVIDAGEGTVTVLDQATQSGGRLTAAARRVRPRIGFIFQQFNLVGRLTLFTNAALGSLGRVGFWRGLLGLWPGQIRAEVMAALAKVGVDDQASQRANTLSGGQQQRGAIARALVQQAEVILADEPVASLDPVAARRVMAVLRELNRHDGMTVLVTLHQVDHALRYCDRVIALAGGRIAYDGSTEGLSKDILSDVYGPEFQDAFWEGAPS